LVLKIEVNEITVLFSSGIIHLLLKVAFIFG